MSVVFALIGFVMAAGIKANGCAIGLPGKPLCEMQPARFAESIFVSYFPPSVESLLDQHLKFIDFGVGVKSRSSCADTKLLMRPKCANTSSGVWCREWKVKAMWKVKAIWQRLIQNVGGANSPDFISGRTAIVDHQKTGLEAYAGISVLRDNSKKIDGKIRGLYTLVPKPLISA